jgi:hypothetical protein
MAIVYVCKMETQKYNTIKVLSHSDFKRCTGVTKFVFDLMVLVTDKWHKENRKKDGRPNKLSTADQILMLLEYYREYRTFFHIGLDYGLDESNVQRNIEKIETILLKSDYFRLEGKRILISSKSIKNIRIDVTECPCQRPKKK